MGHLPIDVDHLSMAMIDYLRIVWGDYGVSVNIYIYIINDNNDNHDNHDNNHNNIIIIS